jgi:hypothetical protein
MCSKRCLTAVGLLVLTGTVHAQIKLDMKYGDRAPKNIVTISDLTSSKVVVTASADTAFDKTLELNTAGYTFTDPAGYGGSLRIEFEAWGDGSFVPPNFSGQPALLSFSGNGWGVLDSSSGQMINNDEAMVFSFDFSSLSIGRNPIVLESLELGMGKDFELWCKNIDGKVEKIASGITGNDERATINARVSSGDSFALILPKSPGRLKSMNLDIKRYVPPITKSTDIVVPAQQIVTAPETTPAPTPAVTQQQTPAFDSHPSSPQPVKQPSAPNTVVKPFLFNLTGLFSILLIPLLRKEEEAF